LKWAAVSIGLPTVIRIQIIDLLIDPVKFVAIFAIRLQSTSRVSLLEEVQRIEFFKIFNNRFMTRIIESLIFLQSIERGM